MDKEVKELLQDCLEYLLYPKQHGENYRRYLIRQIKELGISSQLRINEKEEKP